MNRVLAFDRNERFPSARAMLDLLRSVLAATPEPPPTTARSRQQTMIGVAPTAVLAAKAPSTSPPPSVTDLGALDSPPPPATK